MAELGDIVEHREMPGLLWEVVSDEFYEFEGGPPCNKVVYWGCPPGMKLGPELMNRLRTVDPTRHYRVEARVLKQPKNAMMVIAISSLDPDVSGHCRIPWREVQSG